MLDQRTIQVVKSTIGLLESAGPALTEHFYQRMFKHNPELKDIFNLAHQHTGGQPVALFNAIAAYAKNIDNLAVLSTTVERIAHKHTGFLIRPEHYHIVGEHLLATLQELGGDAVNEEVLDAWGKAYGFLANIFIGRETELYRQSAATSGGWTGTRPFRISNKTVESEVITSFLLTPVDELPVMAFLPGQYLSVQLNHPKLLHQEIRQYSLSDAPNGHSYRISVKRELEGQVSNLLHDDYQLGDILDIAPPAGDFSLQANDNPVVLISAGVGLTPMMSMLASLLPQDDSSSHSPVQAPSTATKATPLHCEGHTLVPQAEITWLHACEHGGVHSFKTQLKEQSQRYQHLHSYVWYRNPRAQDRPAEDYDFDGTIKLAKVSRHIQPHAHYYFCGPIAFMREVKQQLLALNVPESQLHYEVFGPDTGL